MLKKSSSHGYLLIITAGALWGTTGTSQACIPGIVNPLSVAIIRLLIGSIFLGVFLIFTGNIKNIIKPWPVLPLIITAICIAAFQLCFFSAVIKTGVAAGTMIAAGTSPIFAGILGMIVYRERLTYRWALATAAAVSGCVLLTAGKDMGFELSGILLALAASLLYTLYGMGIRKLTAYHSGAEVIAALLSLGLLILLPLVFMVDFAWINSREGLLIAIFLGIAATAIPYMLFSCGISRICISHVYTLSLSEPLTACLLGIFFLKEKLSSLGLSGIILLFGGLLILSLPLNMISINNINLKLKKVRTLAANLKNMRLKVESAAKSENCFNRQD